MPEPTTQQKNALFRILAATRSMAAQATLAAAVMGSAAALYGANLPPELAGFVGAVGYQAIYDLLKRLASGDDIADDTIEQELAEALSDAQVAQVLGEAETQAMIGRLFRRVDLVEYAVRDGQTDLLDRLTGLAGQYASLREELTAQFASLASREQADQILAEIQRLSIRLQTPGRTGTSVDIPPPHVNFLGREDDIQWLLNRLQPGRTVTLCGPGGIGKSAIVAQALNRLQRAGTLTTLFPGGVFYHDFYKESQAAVALENIARECGEEPRPTRAAAAQRALANRTGLLVLDGCEQADDLDAVLAVRGQCAVMLTSRRHSDAPGEWRDLEPLPSMDAMTLLLDWAGNRIASPREARAIVELLGRLPLAVRLAGRYLATSGESATDYEKWLRESRLDALDHGKHQAESVPVLLARSIEALDDATQAALAVVGVLAPVSFDRSSVAAALDTSPAQAGRWLGKGVDYGLLLRPDERYTVSHALVHTFLRKRCVPTRDTVARLAANFTELSEEQSALGPAGYAVLNGERPHLGAVVQSCRDVGAWDALDRIAWAIHGFLEINGYWTEGMETMNAGLRGARMRNARANEGRYLGEIGSFHLRFGDARRAIEHYEQALEISREIGDRRGEGNHLGNLGLARYRKGDVGAARALWLESATIFEAIESPHAATVRGWLAQLDTPDEDEP